MTPSKQYEELAARCEQATGPDRQLDLEIAYAVEHETWIEPHCAKNAYTASLDAAMTLAEPFMLVALYIAADGLTSCCLCSDTSTNPPTEHWGVPTERGDNRQGILARAVTAAALRARSQGS